MLIGDIKSISSTRKDLRNFGLTVGGALVVLSALLWWWAKPAWVYLGAVGIALALFGLAAPAMLKPLQKVWMTLAVVLGWVMTRVLLSLLFFTMFTAIGLIGRVFGKEFLSIKWKGKATTYWNYRKPESYDKRRTEMQF